MGSLCNSIVHQIWHRVACATNCFAHAHTIALCMFAQLLCACPIYTSHRHAHAIALHMRKPLPCACAPLCLAHAQAITPRTSTICKHASRLGMSGGVRIWLILGHKGRVTLLFWNYCGHSSHLRSNLLTGIHVLGLPLLCWYHWLIGNSSHPMKSFNF